MFVQRIIKFRICNSLVCVSCGTPLSTSYNGLPQLPQTQSHSFDYFYIEDNNIKEMNAYVQIYLQMYMTQNRYILYAYDIQVYAQVGTCIAYVCVCSYMRRYACTCTPFSVLLGFKSKLLTEVFVQKATNQQYLLHKTFPSRKS